MIRISTVEEDKGENDEDEEDNDNLHRKIMKK